MSEPGSIDDLEVVLARLLGTGVMLSSIALAAGLVTVVFSGTGRLATFLLTSGIVLLIGTPIARVVVSSVGYARRRDWLFVMLTLIVLAELIASIFAAVRGS